MDGKLQVRKKKERNKGFGEAGCRRGTSLKGERKDKDQPSWEIGIRNGYCGCAGSLHLEGKARVEIHIRKRLKGYSREK